MASFALCKQPTDPELEEAFGILEDTIGSSEFTEAEAKSVLQSVLEDDGAAAQIWSRLKKGNYVEEC